jgi:hypothetical protein
MAVSWGGPCIGCRGFADLDAELEQFAVDPGSAPGAMCPQKSIGGREFRPLHGALKDSELVAQRENLPLERSTAPKRDGK